MGNCLRSSAAASICAAARAGESTASTAFCISFGIAGVIVEFARDGLAGFPVAPFGVADACGADAAAHGRGWLGGLAVVVGGTRMLGEGGGLHAGLRRDGESGMRLMPSSPRAWAGRKVDERGEEIEQFGERSGLPAMRCALPGRR